MKKYSIVFIFLSIAIIYTNCRDNISIPQTTSEEGSWIIYSPIKWSHDGNPHSGVYCKVYSDGADPGLKDQCLDFADRLFQEIMLQFGITSFDNLTLPSENEKINVYINTDHEENIAYAYWGTVFITVRSSFLDTILYRYLFKHELTHELEFMIEQDVNLGSDFWFREGIAIFCGGGFYKIRSVADLDNWIMENENFPGQGNPIIIHEWSDFPSGANIDRYYWYAFDIAMRYILDPTGLGKTFSDVLKLFYDIGDGYSFSASFQDNFGISLKAFEEEFYFRIRTYLKISN